VERTPELKKNRPPFIEKNTKKKNNKKNQTKKKKEKLATRDYMVTTLQGMKKTKPRVPTPPVVEGWVLVGGWW